MVNYLLEDYLRGASTLSSYKYIRLKVGCIMLIISSVYFERRSIGIITPSSCTLVFWVLIFFLLCNICVSNKLILSSQVVMNFLWQVMHHNAFILVDNAT